MSSAAEPHGAIAMVLGPITALFAAGLLSHFRDGAGSANVALVLACVVVAAALAGRVAGAATAVTAAIAYNFFHTKPYNSLRVDSTRDVVTIALLVTIGLAVSEMSAWRRRARAASDRQLDAARFLERTAEMLARGDDADQVWFEVRAALVVVLHLSDCRFERGSTTSVPDLPRTGTIIAKSMRYGRGGFQLPDTGLSLPVQYGDRTLGHIILIPDQSSGSSVDARQAAVGLADQFALALRMTELTHH